MEGGVVAGGAYEDVEIVMCTIGELDTGRGDAFDGLWDEINLENMDSEATGKKKRMLLTLS